MSDRTQGPRQTKPDGQRPQDLNDRWEDFLARLHEDVDAYMREHWKEVAEMVARAMKKAAQDNPCKPGNTDTEGSVR
jgi:hypothetical protein